VGLIRYLYNLLYTEEHSLKIKTKTAVTKPRTRPRPKQVVWARYCHEAKVCRQTHVISVMTDNHNDLSVEASLQWVWKHSVNDVITIFNFWAGLIFHVFHAVRRNCEVSYSTVSCVFYCNRLNRKRTWNWNIQ